MKLIEALNKIKLPKTKDLNDINKNLRNNKSSKLFYEVDIIYLSKDFKVIDKDLTGIKNFSLSTPIIDINLNPKLSVFISDNSVIMSKNGRETYVIVQDSPYTLDISKTKKISAYIEVKNDDSGNIDKTELTQKLLANYGTVKLIDEINEKSNDGLIIILIMGILIGCVLMSIVLAYLYG